MGGVRRYAWVAALLAATLLWWAFLLCGLASLIGWLPATMTMGAAIALTAVAASCAMYEPGRNAREA